MRIADFRKVVYDYYYGNKREYPWRATDNPYHIYLSEIMLQQTQTDRVLPKYEAFLKKYPTLLHLGNAAIPDLLSLWKGLGYNRRALNLREGAKRMGADVPSTYDELIRIPGIGEYTANAILAFAFREPRVFIETNIRRVFIHHFTKEEEKVRDAQLVPFIERALDRTDPREWYYALMDYGSSLKRRIPNPNRRSAHYVKQPRFEGSDRQLRGMILSLLLERDLPIEDIISHLASDPIRVRRIVDGLCDEGFIEDGPLVSLRKG